MHTFHNNTSHLCKATFHVHYTHPKLHLKTPYLSLSYMHPNFHLWRRRDVVLGSQAERGIRSGYDVKVVSGEGGVVRSRSQAQWGAQIRVNGIGHIDGS